MNLQKCIINKNVKYGLVGPILSKYVKLKINCEEPKMISDFYHGISVGVGSPKGLSHTPYWGFYQYSPHPSSNIGR